MLLTGESLKLWENIWPLHIMIILSFPQDSNSSKPVQTKHFWSYIKFKKSHDVGIAPLKENGVDVIDSIGKPSLLSK